MSPKPHRILIIEDDPDTCSNLKDILELDGYTVEVANTMAAALDRKNWPDYLAIILDWKLPDGNAEILLPKLRDIAPTAAVIVETGAVGLDGAITAIRHGAVDYIVKPIDPHALLISIRRVADQRRLFLEKKRSEDAFRKLVEAASSMIVILRVDGTIAYWNRFAEQTTGYASQEVAGQDFIQIFIPAEEQERCRSKLMQVTGGMSMQGFETQIRCRNGDIRWLMCNAQNLDDYDGDPAILAIGQDITEHKHSKEQLLQAERLAAMGRAMTGLAHESRNALQRSQAGLEMLSRRVQDIPEAQQLIQRIQKAQDDLHQLYEEVREYAAPMRLNLMPTKLGELLQAEWENLALLRENRTATLYVEQSDVKQECLVDSFALRQCFRNILENSLAACSDPVEIYATFADAQIVGRPALQVTIRDNGPGLSAEQQARIFEEFFTTKTRGTGLGMAICRRFVEAHGGQIEACRTDQPGAVIRITLPRTSA